MGRSRRRNRDRSSLRLYAVIFVACGLLALVVHYLSDVPDKFERYADERIEGAVRNAVKAEIQEASRSGGQIGCLILKTFQIGVPLQG